MRSLVAAVYKLEGDRLEIPLAYRLIEELRELGKSLDKQDQLPKVDELLRARAQLARGLKYAAQLLSAHMRPAPCL